MAVQAIYRNNSTLSTIRRLIFQQEVSIFSIAKARGGLVSTPRSASATSRRDHIGDPCLIFRGACSLVGTVRTRRLRGRMAWGRRKRWVRSRTPRARDIQERPARCGVWRVVRTVSRRSQQPLLRGVGGQAKQVDGDGGVQQSRDNDPHVKQHFAPRLDWRPRQLRAHAAGRLNLLAEAAPTAVSQHLAKLRLAGLEGTPPTSTSAVCSGRPCYAPTTSTAIAPTNPLPPSPRSTWVCERPPDQPL